MCPRVHVLLFWRNVYHTLYNTRIYLCVYDAAVEKRHRICLHHELKIFPNFSEYHRTHVISLSHLSMYRSTFVIFRSDYRARYYRSTTIIYRSTFRSQTCIVCVCVYIYIYIHTPPPPSIDYGERLAIGCGGKIRGRAFSRGSFIEEQRASRETVPGNGSVVRLKGRKFLNEGQPLSFFFLSFFSPLALFFDSD